MKMPTTEDMTPEQIEQLELTKGEEFRLRLMRLHAIGCSDGHGSCKFCGVDLVPAGTDEGHPFPLCPGPPAKCSTCGAQLELTDGRYGKHACARKEVVRATPDELQRPRRTGDWYD